MCLTEIWTFSECGCRFDHHVPCHPRFFRPCSPAAQHGQIQPLPATPPPSRSADDGAWSSYPDIPGYGAVRQCSVRHIEHRTFREPICDDCLLEELGLGRGAGHIVPPVENGLDGEEWLLESKVEIHIDQASTTDHETVINPLNLVDDMPTLRVGTGFASLGDGDADDEEEVAEDFRGRSMRRSAIDIDRENTEIAKSWMNWDLTPRVLSKSTSKGRVSPDREKTVRSLVTKVRDTELGKLADKAKRGLRLTIDRAKSNTSKVRSDTSKSPTKTSWESESSGIRTLIIVSSLQREDLGETEQAKSVQAMTPATHGTLTALPDGESFEKGYHRLTSTDFTPPGLAEDIEITTPTSIASSAANDIAHSLPARWEDHLQHDLGQRNIRAAESSLPAAPGNKCDLHFDADHEGRRLLSTDTTHSFWQTPRNASSGNWVGLDDGTRLDTELAKTELDHDNENRRLLSTTTTPSFTGTASKHSSATWVGSSDKISMQNVNASIPNAAKSVGHAHRPSTSSIASLATSFSPSPQTSLPRPSPRARQALSYHPLTTMLQIATPTRPNWCPRNSSFHSPPLRSPYRLGLEASPMQRSPILDSTCVHEVGCCAICEDGVGMSKVVSCGCVKEGGMQDCRALRPTIKRIPGMEVCDQCS